MIEIQPKKNGWPGDVGGGQHGQGKKLNPHHLRKAP